MHNKWQTIYIKQPIHFAVSFSYYDTCWTVLHSCRERHITPLLNQVMKPGGYLYTIIKI